MQQTDFLLKLCLFTPRLANPIHRTIFWETHVFNAILHHKQTDFLEWTEFETRMQTALACWQSAWDNMPEDWLEANRELSCLDPEIHLQRLSNEANGDLWLKLP
ncbi:hypothetical protein KFZ76_19255 [Methylovulum psychrotolerans]|uniref:HipA family kinase n=1 Tax=Methylovulum psychrotolerans TaxID=1704499 RepID=UPI001BFFAAFF|nr:HipA family kinase [Methylovulum psychrotolerans]MBT9099838.1 hypothetical protein [Methylovulum psychrotolerans]